MSDDKSVVATIGPRGLATDLLANGHALRADEPVAKGGTDQGPTPYGYLLSALGSCTAMTLRIYADRKGMPLEGASVRVLHDRVHAADCADCETKVGKVDVIERVLELRGPLSADQRADLLRIADRCPVHRLLISEIKIRTRLE